MGPCKVTQFRGAPLGDIFGRFGEVHRFDTVMVDTSMNEHASEARRAALEAACPLEAPSADWMRHGVRVQSFVHLPAGAERRVRPGGDAPGDHTAGAGTLHVGESSVGVRASAVGSEGGWRAVRSCVLRGAASGCAASVLAVRPRWRPAARRGGSGGGGGPVAMPRSLFTGLLPDGGAVGHSGGDGEDGPGVVQRALQELHVLGERAGWAFRVSLAEICADESVMDLLEPSSGGRKVSSPAGRLGKGIAGVPGRSPRRGVRSSPTKTRRGSPAARRSPSKAGPSDKLDRICLGGASDQLVALEVRSAAEAAKVWRRALHLRLGQFPPGRPAAKETDRSDSHRHAHEFEPTGEGEVTRRRVWGREDWEPDWSTPLKKAMESQQRSRATALGHLVATLHIVGDASASSIYFSELSAYSDTEAIGGIGRLGSESRKSFDTSICTLRDMVLALSTEEVSVHAGRAALTRVLRPMLGGPCLTSILVASPVAEGSLSTLKASSRLVGQLREIVNRPQPTLMIGAAQGVRVSDVLRMRRWGDCDKQSSAGGTVSSHHDAVLDGWDVEWRQLVGEAVLASHIDALAPIDVINAPRAVQEGDAGHPTQAVRSAPNSRSAPVTPRSRDDGVPSSTSPRHDAAASSKRKHRPSGGAEPLKPPRHTGAADFDVGPVLSASFLDVSAIADAPSFRGNSHGVELLDGSGASLAAERRALTAALEETDVALEQSATRLMDALQRYEQDQSPEKEARSSSPELGTAAASAETPTRAGAHAPPDSGILSDESKHLLFDEDFGSFDPATTEPTAPRRADGASVSRFEAAKVRHMGTQSQMRNTSDAAIATDACSTNECSTETDERMISEQQAALQLQQSVDEAIANCREQAEVALRKFAATKADELRDVNAKLHRESQRANSAHKKLASLESAAAERDEYKSQLSALQQALDASEEALRKTHGQLEETRGRLSETQHTEQAALDSSRLMEGSTERLNRRIGELETSLRECQSEKDRKAQKLLELEASRRASEETARILTAEISKLGQALATERAESTVVNETNRTRAAESAALLAAANVDVAELRQQVSHLQLKGAQAESLHSEHVLALNADIDALQQQRGASFAKYQETEERSEALAAEVVQLRADLEVITTQASDSASECRTLTAELLKSRQERAKTKIELEQHGTTVKLLQDQLLQASSTAGGPDASPGESTLDKNGRPDASIAVGYSSAEEPDHAPPFIETVEELRQLRKQVAEAKNACDDKDSRIGRLQIQLDSAFAEIRRRKRDVDLPAAAETDSSDAEMGEERSPMDPVSAEAAMTAQATVPSNGTKKAAAASDAQLSRELGLETDDASGGGGSPRHAGTAPGDWRSVSESVWERELSTARGDAMRAQEQLAVWKDKHEDLQHQVEQHESAATAAQYRATQLAHQVELLQLQVTKLESRDAPEHPSSAGFDDGVPDFGGSDGATTLTASSHPSVTSPGHNPEPHETEVSDFLLQEATAEIQALRAQVADADQRIRQATERAYEAASEDMRGDLMDANDAVKKAQSQVRLLSERVRSLENARDGETESAASKLNEAVDQALARAQREYRRDLNRAIGHERERGANELRDALEMQRAELLEAAEAKRRQQAVQLRGDAERNRTLAVSNERRKWKQKLAAREAGLRREFEESKAAVVDSIAEASSPGASTEGDAAPRLGQHDLQRIKERVHRMAEHHLSQLDELRRAGEKEAKRADDAERQVAALQSALANAAARAARSTADGASSTSRASAVELKLATLQAQAERLNSLAGILGQDGRVGVTADALALFEGGTDAEPNQGGVTAPRPLQRIGAGGKRRRDVSASGASDAPATSIPNPERGGWQDFTATARSDSNTSSAGADPASESEEVDADARQEPLAISALATPASKSFLAVDSSREVQVAALGVPTSAESSTAT